MTPQHLLISLRVALLTLVLRPLGGCAAAPAPTDSPDEPIRVMTFNIRFGTAGDGDDAWPHRRDLVFNVLRDHEPDVVGLQEALRFQLNEIRNAVHGYDELGVGRTDGREGGEYAAVLVRADRFEVLDSGTFWLSDTPDVPGSRHWGNRVTRICTWAHLAERRTGRRMRIYNVHLDHESQPSRERSVDLILSRIATCGGDDPVVLTGDFNAGESNEAMRRIMSGGAATQPRLVDSFRIMHPKAVNVGTFNAFRDRADGDKIDYVLVSPDLEVLDAAIVRDHAGERYPSDHFPVTATVRLRD